MATIYLVRHGEAAAHWADAADPGLSARGEEQAKAAARKLAALGPLPIVSSPLRRARETAVPLQVAWQATVRIEPAVSEIPSPGIPLGERSAWLTQLMHGSWNTAQPELQHWRATLLGFLA